MGIDHVSGSSVHVVACMKVILGSSCAAIVNRNIFDNSAEEI